MQDLSFEIGRYSTVDGHLSVYRRPAPHFGQVQAPIRLLSLMFIHYNTNIINCNRNHIEIPGKI